MTNVDRGSVTNLDHCITLMFIQPGHQKLTHKNQSLNSAERHVVFEPPTFQFECNPLNHYVNLPYLDNEESK